MKEIRAFKTRTLEHGLKRHAKLCFKLKCLKRPMQKKSQSAGAFQNVLLKCFQ